MSAAASASASDAVQPMRWGILACGKISHDFVNAIRHLPDVEVVACAARSLDDAQAFAKLFNIPRSYGSYAEIAADPTIDVMYIGTLHPQHAAPAMLCLTAGKHVLVEKPFAVTAADGAEVIALAQRKGLFLMEAMWTRFIPSICKVRELIAAGVIGEPKMVHASFGFLMDGPEIVPRLWQNEHAGGCTLDLGVYPITLASMIFGEGGKNAPSKITATGDLSEGEKVDTQIGVTLQYGPHRMAVLSCSMLCKLPNEAYIIGDRGSIRIHAHNSWHCSQRISYKLTAQSEADATVIDFPETRRDDQFEFKFGDSQLMVHECREVMRRIRAGHTQSDIHPLKETAVIAATMDEVRRQIGVVFKEDRANAGAK